MAAELPARQPLRVLVLNGKSDQVRLAQWAFIDRVDGMFVWVRDSRGPGPAVKVHLSRIVCAWWALCSTKAASLRPHPLLGEVPICPDCDEKANRLAAAVTR
jgi:hypothetical protein